MGCGSSSLQQNNVIPGQSSRCINFLMDNLHLTEGDVSKYKKAFKKLDLMQDGFVEFDEFCSRIRCEPTVFLSTLFKFFSSSSVEHQTFLNFSEFILFTTFYLTLDEAGLAKFLYIMLTDPIFNHRLPKYVKATHGHMENHILLLFGQAWGDPHHIKKVMHRMDVNKDGLIHSDEFVKSCIHNKSLLFPIVSYQMDMRSRIISKGFWESKVGLGNGLLRTICNIRNDLHSILETERPDTDVAEINIEEVNDETSYNNNTTNYHKSHSNDIERKASGTY